MKELLKESESKRLHEKRVLIEKIQQLSITNQRLQIQLQQQLEEEIVVSSPALVSEIPFPTASTITSNTTTTTTNTTTKKLFSMDGSEESEENPNDTPIKTATISPISPLSPLSPLSVSPRGLSPLLSPQSSSSPSSTSTSRFSELKLLSLQQQQNQLQYEQIHKMLIDLQTTIKTHPSSGNSLSPLSTDKIFRGKEHEQKSNLGQLMFLQAIIWVCIMVSFIMLVVYKTFQSPSVKTEL